MRLVTTLLLTGVMSNSLVLATEDQGMNFRGEAALEAWAFSSDGAQGQARENVAGRLSISLWKTFNGGNDTLSITPFVRIDGTDSTRSHADLREAAWVHPAGSLELRAGIRQVFWGVTEGTHLVDIINQTDAVDSLDGEQKLGQPMLNLSLEHGTSLLDFFVLTGSRERTFPGADGRLRLPLLVDKNLTQYESSHENRHIDLAARWQITADKIRIGISGFSGTAREPELQVVIDPTRISYAPDGIPTGFQSGYQPVFAPYYPVIQQAGLDLQVTQGDLLWKVEAVQRHGYARTYHASNSGMEYTQVGAFGTTLDVGWLAEYLHDNRGEMSTSAFEHDVLIGWRIAFNNTASSEILASMIVDDHTGETLFSLEGAHRLGENLRIALEMRHFSHTPSPQSTFDFLTQPDLVNKLRPLANDDFIRIEATWFF